MSKPTQATKYIHQAADRCKAGQVSIDWDSAFCTVCISAPGQDDIFMQGDEARDYIDQFEATCKRYPSLDEYTAALAQAEQYAECIWA